MRNLFIGIAAVLAVLSAGCTYSGPGNLIDTSSLGDKGEVYARAWATQPEVAAKIGTLESVKIIRQESLAKSPGYLYLGLGEHRYEEDSTFRLRGSKATVDLRLLLNSSQGKPWTVIVKEATTVVPAS